MKALSVRQPWAWAIVNGFKPVENRTWRTDWRGELLIHAGLAPADIDSWRMVRMLLELDGHDPDDIPALDAFALGGIVGRAELCDCVRQHSSDWFQGPFGFVLRDAKPCRLIPCRGQLGIFEIDEQKLGLPAPAAAGQGSFL